MEAELHSFLTFVLVHVLATLPLEKELWVGP